MASTHNRLKNTTPVITPTKLRQDSEATTPESDTEGSILEAEAAAMRREKLATIKKAVAAGAYDSDELLEKAMLRMKERIENEDDSE